MQRKSKGKTNSTLTSIQQREIQQLLNLLTHPHHVSLSSYDDQVWVSIIELGRFLKQYVSYRHNALELIMEECRYVEMNRHVWMAIFWSLTSNKIMQLCQEHKSIDAQIVALTGKRIDSSEQDEPFLALRQKLELCDYHNDSTLWKELYESKLLSDSELISLCVRHLKMFEVVTDHSDAIPFTLVMEICKQADSYIYWKQAVIASVNADELVAIVTAAHSFHLFRIARRKKLFAIGHYEQIIDNTHYFPVRSIAIAKVRYEKHSTDKLLETIRKTFLLRMHISMPPRLKKLLGKYHGITLGTKKAEDSLSFFFLSLK